MGFNFGGEGNTDEPSTSGAGIFDLFGGAPLPSLPQAESTSEFSFSFGGATSGKDDNAMPSTSEAFSLF